MATSKANRTVPLAQLQPQHAKNARAGDPKPKRRSPNPEQVLRPKYGLRISPAGSDARKGAQPTELMPVKAHAYRTLAELNGGFEKVILDLQTLGQISYFHSDRVTAMHDLICRVRAEANRDFITALHGRETANAGHFEHLCIEWEKSADS
jgi:hypothetical protein